MKKITGLAVFILLSITITSQNWISPNAVWHYDFSLNGHKGFNKYMYIGDTTVHGKDCQHIQSSEYNFFIQPDGSYIGGGPSGFQSWFTYNNDDTIFYLHDSAFKILYNFDAVTGDSWLFSDDTTGGCNPTYFIVNGHGTVQVNSITRRYIDIESSTGSKYYFNGRAIEGIGMAGNNPNGSYFPNSVLFPIQYNCDSIALSESYFISFKCFQDSITPLYNPSGIDCEYLLNHVGIYENINQTGQIYIYPNPATDLLNIKINNLSNSSWQTIEIFNLQGKKVKQVTTPTNQNQLQLDVSGIAKGIYICRINNGKQSLVQKFVKN